MIFDHTVYKKAAEFAQAAHQGQKRRDGRDYFSHVEAVADILFNDWHKLIPESARLNFDKIFSEAQAAAFLHDTLEDTSTTKQDLIDAGFSVTVVEIVEILTRHSGETYYDYIGRILDSGALSRLAGAIKMADLLHNMSDLKEGSMKDKYRFAFHILHSRCPSYTYSL